MKQYLDLLERIINTGEVKGPARENMPGTRQLFGEIILKFDLSDGFPLLTTKKVFMRGMIEELLWFLRGDTNVSSLINKNVHIWNEDAYKFYVKNLEHGSVVKSFDEWLSDASKEECYSDYNMGTLYGQLWRNFGFHKFPISENEDIVIKGVDQITNLVNDIIMNPNGRYKVVTAWNPWIIENKQSALPSCHYMFQCNVRNGKDNSGNDVKFLDLAIVQRSCDMPLGVPLNIASYALLVHILGLMTATTPGVLKWIGMDCHIYENQIEQANVQISREPRKLPELKINIDKNMYNSLIDKVNIGWQPKDIEKFFNFLSADKFELIGYDPHPKLEYPLSTGLVK